MKNPFNEADTDRISIWEMLMNRDFEAFINNDWSMIADDFIEEGFIGIDGRHNGNPDSWKLSFPNLEAYKIEWLKQAKAFEETDWSGDAKTMLLQATVLRDIEINGNSALAHKKFLGAFVKSNGEKIPANWQTIYYCRRINGTWKIIGFTGYLPHFSNPSIEKKDPGIHIPSHARQHSTAGPYSPVLIVNPSSLVVISGQAAIKENGDIIGETIEVQAGYTIENCKRQLAFAGCDLNDVFKVNVFMKDLADWPKFNDIYKKYFNNPLPVRTAVQAGLLDRLLVEIEMWAIKI